MAATSGRGVRRRVIALLAVGLTIGNAFAADAPSEDPAALAARYAKQATDLRASAEEHAKRAAAHRSQSGSSKGSHESIANHCEQIAKNLRAAADETDKLAATYRGLAKPK